MKVIEDIRAGTKIEAVAIQLMNEGRITNVEVLLGNPIRTNRLSAIIHTLNEEYGMNIDSKTERYPDGKYKDCVYTLIEEGE